MSQKIMYGIEQARAQLPRIVTEAHAGAYSVITKHGKPYAAVVPLQELEKLQAARKPRRDLLALRGTGKGLWGSDVGKTVTELRDEWDDA
ncbi:MAG: type II toxin-antitoxin system Phd/YefM family antitoxin [Halothiobacillaceae bacterium]|nr:type II toxin-antitoxin system Phd/YefM family antitoxin [Halothiobacillaceae bacterium]